MGEKINKSEYVKRAKKYISDVLTGKVEACKWVKLACERQKEDRKRWSKKTDLYVFDDTESGPAHDVCWFIENLSHVKGEWAKRKETIKLEPWQIFILTVAFGWKKQDGTRRFRTVYIEVPRKNGKALALDTPVPTPSGWSTIGDLQTGDHIFGADGNICRVIETSPVFYGHDCFRVNFSNGESVVADARHLWMTTARVNMPGERKKRKIKRYRPPSLRRRNIEGTKRWFAQLYGRQVYIGRCDDRKSLLKFKAMAKKDLKEHPIGINYLTRTRTTEEIFSTQRYGTRNDVNHSIYMPKPLQLPEKDLPVDPYFLGVWLGDGTSTSAVITCGNDDVGFLSKELKKSGFHIESRRDKTAWRMQIRNKTVDDIGNDIVVSKYGKDNLVKKMRGLDVIKNKHIPSEYLRASYEQRLSLMQGLMDTDGTADSRGRAQSFTSVNKRLAYDFSELAATFGIKCTIKESDPVCNGKKVDGTVYLVQFHTFLDNVPVFRTPRKLRKMKHSNGNGTLSRSQTVQITSVEKVDTVPTKCISVDSESRLFLFGRTMLPTHNSSLSSGVGLYMLARDGEAGSEVYSAAVTRDQAKIVWEDAKRMVNKDQDFQSHFNVNAMAHSIFQEKTGSKFMPLSSDANSLEGLNVHCGIIDELHAHKTREVYDVLEMATGSRSQPLLWNITTAGSNRAGICYEVREYLTKVLQGVVDDDSFFGMIYTIDDGDDWADPSVWKKANPNYGISIYPDDFERLARKALEMPSATNNFLTKRLDLWVNADTAWMDMKAWDRAGDKSLRIEAFDGQECWIGLDLASKVDIAAKVLLFTREFEGKVHYYAFGRYYLPESAVEESRNSQYSGWARMERLIVTPGNVTDYDYIKDDMREDSKKYQLKEVPYDPFQATQLSTEMFAEGFPMVEVRPTVLNFSEPMKSLEALVLSGRFHHDGCPVLTWMVSNVVCHRDQKDNIYPRKEREENKIDGVVALLMCLNRAIVPVEGERSCYEDRGAYVF